MISLLKFLDVPWETARHYLREDLDHLESALNQRWGVTFGDANLLQPGTIGGDSTPATRYIANTGTGNTLEWNTVNLTNGVSGLLAAIRGGTGLSSYTIGDVVYADSSATLAKLADVATGNALLSGGVGAAPAYGKIGLTTHITGTLPVANGGTGVATLAADGVLYGNAAGVILVTAQGPANSVLTANAGAPSFSASPTLTGLTVTNPITGSVTGSSGSTTGNAATATTLATGRTISISGDLAYTSPSFDGSGNVTAAGTLATVNANIGSFTSADITVDAKGRITAAANGSGGGGSVTSVSGTLNRITSTGGATPVIDISASYIGQSSITTVANSINLPVNPTTTTQSPADNSTKIATTAYVDNAILGQRLKEAVKYGSVAALPSIVYANGSSGVGATLTGVALAAISLDGASPSVADRVLIKNQVSDFQNGIYVVTQTGSGIAVFILTRTIDFDQASDIQTGDSVFVTAGSTLANTTWTYNGIDSPTMGTTSITVTQAAGPGSYTAGNGITITGVSIAVTSPVVIANGGTGQTTAVDAFDALAPTTTQGDTIYHNGTDNIRLAKGTGLQVLRMNAGATALEWATTTGTGDVVGPGVAVDGIAAVFDGTTGKLIKQFTPTAGSLLFAGTSGILAQNNSMLFWNDSTQRLGIGTVAPSGFVAISTPKPALISTTPATAATNGLVTGGGSGGDTDITTTGVGGVGSAVSLVGGPGGKATAAATASTGGVGGSFTENAGAGGAANVAGTGTNTGGVGGVLQFNCGAGGAATGASSGTNAGGVGGAATFQGGTGGAANTGSGTNTGGNGGTISVKGGIGGVGATTSGSGGLAQVVGGVAAAGAGSAGGNATLASSPGTSTGSGGAGGTVAVTGAAAGGDDTVTRAGGPVNITAGTSKGSGVGGAITVTAGAGGIGTSTTGAVGGALNFNAGIGGDNTTDGAGGIIAFSTAATLTRSERMRITAVGNIKIGGSAARGTTEGAGHLDIFNGTDPVGTLTNGISLYARSGELYVMDAAGNETLRSPHNKEGKWIHSDTNFKGRRLVVQMEDLLKAVNERLGLDFIQETYV